MLGLCPSRVGAASISERTLALVIERRISFEDVTQDLRLLADKSQEGDHADFSERG
jgi:hypothetical protein